ncbi:MAG: peptide chain release factor N(5)-glutamine methyltransferase [Candidatus Methylomirabilia bacterium]
MSETIAAAVDRGRTRLAAVGIEAAGLEACVLFEHAAGLDRAALLARGREPVEPEAARRYERLLDERSQRTPLAYVTGEREFWSLRMRVDRRVLVPRPETETLVEAALDRLSPGARVADVGTGSGAIVIALALELGSGAFVGTDHSADAIAVARANAAEHGLAQGIEFIEGDLLAPLCALPGLLDALVSNPPYIPTAELGGLEPEVRDFEPRTALDGGCDGLAVIERIITDAPLLLRRGGWLLLEIGAGQAGRVRALLRRTGRFEEISTRCDLAGIERVVAARKAA